MVKQGGGIPCLVGISKSVDEVQSGEGGHSCSRCRGKHPGMGGVSRGREKCLSSLKEVLANHLTTQERKAGHCPCCPLQIGIMQTALVNIMGKNTLEEILHPKDGSGGGESETTSLAEICNIVSNGKSA